MQYIGVARGELGILTQKQVRPCGQGALRSRGRELHEGQSARPPCQHAETRRRGYLRGHSNSSGGAVYMQTERMGRNQGRACSRELSVCGTWRLADAVREWDNP